MSARLRVLSLLTAFALAFSTLTITASAVAADDGTDPSGTTAPSSDTPKLAPDVPATTIIEKPTNPSLYRDHTFTFSAPEGDLRFECRLAGPGQSGAFDTCSSSVSDGTTSTGSMVYSDLSPSANPYTFTVRAFRPAGHVEGAPTSYSWRIYSVFSPVNVKAHTGASFNNPLGNKRAKRKNIRRVIDAIHSMPGYREPDTSTAPCPPVGSPMIPAKIRITLYSMTDGPFARALLAAADRCVSVQIIMNNHLSAANDGAWRVLQNGLGKRVKKRNWARRCGYGCRGHSVMHTKMYLFDSSVPQPLSARNTLQNVVMVGSSNMTSNAMRIQWNDLYGVNNAPALFRQYDHMFDLMKLDNGFHRNPKDFVAAGGRYRTTFWPVKAGRTEPFVSLFRSIRCRGVRGGAGVGGRSVVYINMHAWFSARGVKIERAVKSLYRQGCVIKVLYSFMTKGLYHRLKSGTGSRMSLRRTVFSTDGDKYADVYSHFKAIAVSGNVAGKHNARVVWTGSNNFTGGGDRNDEVMIRIASTKAFKQYRNQFLHISRRKSSAKWAYFFERAGGGRAPTPHKRFAGSPTILSPAIRKDADGNPQAVD